MKTLSIVCARAGSKGHKNKCIARINKKMVVEYAIEYSLSLGKDVKTVVSTDIKELMDYCRSNNINYIDRNPAFCADESRIDDTLAEAIEREGEGTQLCSLVYGNIPVRHPSLFHDAKSFLEENEDYDAVISMQNVEKFHPGWMFDLNEDVIPREKGLLYRRQDLPQKMIHDGHTLVFQSESFYKRYKGILEYNMEYRYAIFGSKIKPLLNNEIIIDIDTEKDLKLSEAVIKNRE